MKYEPYHALINAIILQAVKDYRTALDDENTSGIAECERFFRSDWFTFLTAVDGEIIIRQIFVAMDITAPLYWWKEFDTYKVGTTANSCSTMHKIAAKEFELSDFSTEHLVGKSVAALQNVLDVMNLEREHYLAAKDKDCWWQMIQLLPSSYNQRRTVSMTYENVMNMLDYREGHKLDEWREFCKILKQLPYVEVIRDGR